MPGWSSGISRYEIPACFGASGSVRTRVNMYWQWGASEVQIF